jgi:hypothetical protein
MMTGGRLFLAAASLSWAATWPAGSDTAARRAMASVDWTMCMARAGGVWALHIYGGGVVGKKGLLRQEIARARRMAEELE